MPIEEKKGDPFNPQQPSIPGVSNGPAHNATAPRFSLPSRVLQRLASLPIQMPPKWIMVALGGALFLGIVVAWWSRGSTKSKSSSSPAAAIVTAPVEPPKPAEKLPMGPGPIANVDELSNPWSSRRFLFHNSVTNETLPAVLVHLPGGADWAISLREPYGNCTLEYLEDLQKIRSDYGYRAEHPMVGDPCNRSLFDLAKYGPAPGGLVRGQMIHGVAVRPPMAIEIRRNGRDLVAVRME